MKKFIKPFFFVLLFTVQFKIFAQQQKEKANNLVKRYKTDLFTNIDSLIDIPYGEAINLKGENEKLLLNLFMPPAIDTVKNRPLVIFIHGGGFRNNNKSSSISNKLGISLGKKGYVVASIDYRLGIATSNTNKDYHEAMYRAQQDARAAVRFFRKNASKYGIDEDQIFLAGSSAGSMTALAVAYMDQHEIPADIDQNKWGKLEGNGGSDGYSSKVQGVFNLWGSIIDYRWISKGDAPLYNSAGLADLTVPYDSSYDYHSFKYGPSILYQHCLRLGIPTAWRPFYNAGHTLNNQPGQMNLGENKLRQDTLLLSMEHWLFTQLKRNFESKNNSINGPWKYDTTFLRFDSLNKHEIHTDSALLFFGSSYIRFWQNIRKDIGYDDIIHRGFGGCNLRDVAYYIDRILLAPPPKAVFFYVGNDIVDANNDKDPEQVLELFKFVVQEIRNKYPLTPITWLKISPSERRWKVWDKVQQANSLIDAYCKTQSNLYTIGFQAHFLGPDGLPITSLYRDDKLHYNEEGYKVWGNAIKDQVKNILNKKY
jgi:lysophospholipase L1-like esterase/pimeloyl-ACP methyl ester carboxylesterase